MPKKLTTAERLVDEQMLAILEWASDHPTKWHRIGDLEATQKAAELLAKRGVIEISKETNQYRLGSPGCVSELSRLASCTQINCTWRELQA
jgi:hypothetical protein